MDFYIQSAEIRKNDPDFGPDHERTLDSINNVIRLVKIMAKENELPDWIKQKYLL